MDPLLHRLLFVLASSSDHELRRQVQFLKAQNEMLRARLVAPVRLTPAERTRLLKLGVPLGQAIKSLITIVTPENLRPLDSRGVEPHPETTAPQAGATPDARGDSPPHPADRPGDRLGLHPQLGELKKLGIQSISRSTVVNILREEGLDPGVRGTAGTTAEVLRADGVRRAE